MEPQTRRRAAWADIREFLVRAGALAALLVAALAFAGCLVWTPTYFQTVYGFQGRYLLPVLPLFLLTCLPRRVQVASGKQSACTLVCCLCVVNAGVLLNAMLAVIAR